MAEALTCGLPRCADWVTGRRDSGHRRSLRAAAAPPRWWPAAVFSAQPLMLALPLTLLGGRPLMSTFTFEHRGTWSACRCRCWRTRLRHAATVRCRACTFAAGDRSLGRVCGGYRRDTPARRGRARGGHGAAQQVDRDIISGDGIDIMIALDMSTDERGGRQRPASADQALDRSRSMAPRERSWQFIQPAKRPCRLGDLWR